MSKKLVGIDARGKEHTWGVDWYASKEQIEAMRKDGLVVDEIVNVIPEWVVNAGLLSVWCFFQDIWNFRNPFGGADHG